MSSVVVRPRPKPEHADENQRFIEAAFAELAVSVPGGVRYATYRLADGMFVHIADVEREPNPLSTIAAFARFQHERSLTDAARATAPIPSRPN